jgi:hypothetical protein
MSIIPKAIQEHLNQPYQLDDSQIKFYDEHRYIKLKQVFDSHTLAYLNEAVSNRVAIMNQEHRSLEERSTYGKAFLQLFNLWTQDEVVKELVFSKRLGHIATQLMQTNGVRIYHDQALFKEGGGGMTHGMRTNIIGLWRQIKQLQHGFPYRKHHWN